MHDWLDATSAVADLIALDEDGEPVGYCGVYPHWRDADAAYVSILGVIARAQGKKVGKRLLLRAVELAHEKGLKRLDLHTWSGNLNAVPLYKKVGMFWVPETSVYMQDYMPGLLQVPLARAWFDRHPDWYGCFQRELAQDPDKHTVEGMELYEYVFEEDDDRLVAEMDRYGWGLCGLSRRLDGREMAITARLRSHEVMVGLDNELTIAIVNGTDAPLSAALSVEAYKGLTWAEPFPTSLQVPAGEQIAVTRAFVVDSSAQMYRREASEAIRSRVISGDQVLDLVTGAKIQPAVELGCQDAYDAVPPGRTTSVYLDLTNHTHEPLSGQVEVFCKGLSGSQQCIPFSLEGEEVSGIEVPVSVPDESADGSLILYATASIDAEGVQRAMPVYRYPLVVDAAGLTTVVEHANGRQIHLVNNQIGVQVDLEGGRIFLYRRSSGGERRHVGLELGPPYGQSLDETLPYTWETDREDGGLTLVLKAVSRQIPDLEIQKHVRIYPGGSEVEQWTTVVNQQASGPMTVGARLWTGGNEISLNPFSSVARAFVPVGDKVLESDPLLPVLSENLISQDPADWRETWTATQHAVDGQFSAWIWRPEGVSKVKVNGGKLSSTEIAPRTLAPGEACELYRLWYGFSYASLSEVRGRWSQLVGHVEISYLERNYPVQTVLPIEVRLLGEGVVCPGTIRRSVELRFSTAYPFNGTLRLKMPDDWQGAFVTPEGCSETVPLPDPVPGEAIPIEVEWVVPGDAKGAVATVELVFEGELEMAFPLTVVLSNGSAVEVAEAQLENKPVLAVSNGALSFNVCSEIGGNLIRLQDESERTFFYDHFPEVKHFHFFDYHVGGIQPLIFRGDSENLFSEPETVDVQPVEEGAWSGVRASWTVCHNPELRGQSYGLTYLVAPGCPIVRMRVDHRNPTGRRLRWFCGLTLNLALQGDPEGLTVCVPSGDRTWVRHQTPMAFVSQAQLSQPWAWVGKGDQSLTMFVPEGYVGAAIVWDFQMMGIGLLTSQLETLPHGEDVIEYGLALNQSPDKTGDLMQALAQS